MTTMTIEWVSVTVHPRAGKEAIVCLGPGRFEVWVKAKPIGGQANDAVAQMLAQHLQIARQRFQLVKGRTARKKLFRVLTQWHSSSR